MVKGPSGSPPLGTGWSNATPPGTKACSVAVSAGVLTVSALVLLVPALVLRVPALALRVPALVLRVPALVLRVPALALLSADLEGVEMVEVSPGPAEADLTAPAARPLVLALALPAVIFAERASLSGEADTAGVVPSAFTECLRRVLGGTICLTSNS